MFYENLTNVKEEMSKVSKLSPFAKTYLAGAVGLGGLGAAGGALLQTKESLQGDKFKDMTPEEQRARIRRQRLIGAAGGAARGLGYNHLALSTFLPTANRKKDLLNIAGGAALTGLGGTIADYKRLDDAALRANYKRQHGETVSEYNQRIKLTKHMNAANNILSSVGHGVGAARMRDDLDAMFRLRANQAGYGGSLRDAFNDTINQAGGFKNFYKNYRSGAYNASAGAGAGTGGTHTGGDWRASAREFKDLHPDMGDIDIDAELQKVRSGDKDAARALRVKLKKQYRKGSMKHHPDRGGDEETFKKFDTAYRNLDDFLEKNSAWLRAYKQTRFYEKVASVMRRRRY